MKDNNNICKALGLKYVPEFLEICAPLLRTGIMSYFSYSKVYPDKTRIYLSNKPEWFIRYHTEFYSSGISYKLASQSPHRIYCRADFIDQEIFRIGREYFQLPDPIFILNQLEDAQEIFAFGHGSETNAQGLILQHYELIQNFIFYFREKSKKLIQLIQSDRQILPLADRPLENTFLKSPDALLNKIAAYLREETEDYFFKGNGTNQFLTKKEIECARGLSRGEIAKQIANRLGLSARTVEAHLNKAKLKVGAGNSCELIYKLSMLGII